MVDFRVSKGDMVRIERSPYINGHFYMRLRNGSQNFTLGFGYDEPYRETNDFLSHPFFVQARMASTIVNPVNDKWVVYMNDHPRNNATKIFPDLFHILTNWFPIETGTADEINLILELNGIHEYFDVPFSPFAIEGKTNNCRTILLSFLQYSLSDKGLETLKKYFFGNTLFNDNEHGCMIFNIDNGDVFKSNGHPCCWILPMPCCNPVNSHGMLVSRHPVKSTKK